MLTDLFTELKYKEFEISNTEKYLEELKKVNATCKEKAVQLRIQTEINEKLKDSIDTLEKNLDEAILDKTKKQSLLDECELKNTTLQDELAECKERYKALKEEMDNLKETHETEVASKDLELDKDRRMIAKLEKKLMKESQLTSPVSDVNYIIYSI